jgi:hypothetical protein
VGAGHIVRDYNRFRSNRKRSFTRLRETQGHSLGEFFTRDDFEPAAQQWRLRRRLGTFDLIENRSHGGIGFDHGVAKRGAEFFDRLIPFPQCLLNGRIARRCLLRRA